MPRDHLPQRDPLLAVLAISPHSHASRNWHCDDGWWQSAPIGFRTLTTATALETSRGEFARGIAMCLILLLIALLITAATAWLNRYAEQELT